MAQGMPPEEAMMMAGGAPPMGPMGPPMPPPGPVGAPPMGPDPMMGGGDPEDMMIQALMGGVMGKWAGDEAQLSMEKGALLNTLMQIAQAQPPAPDEMFAEGAPMNAGMVPATDVEPPVM